MAENDNDLAKSLSSKDLAGSLRKANFSNLEDGAKAGADFNEIDLVMDVPVQVTVELGRAKMQIRNLLNLTYGSVIELSVALVLKLDSSIDPVSDQNPDYPLGNFCTVILMSYQFIFNISEIQIQPLFVSCLLVFSSFL